MKFLKKNYTEAGYVTDCVQKAALANPGVSYKLIIDGREAFFTSGDGSLQNACYAIFGREFTQSVLSVDYEKNGIKLWGLCGKTNYVRPNKSGQIFFVNGRSVVNKTLSFALSESYKNAVMVGKFPVAVLHVELDPRLVDANVHPAKIEVKFQREHDVYDCLYWGVKNALHAAPTVPQINLEQKSAHLEKPFQFEKPVAEYLAPKEAAPLEKSRPPQQEILFSPQETAPKTTEAPKWKSGTKDVAQDAAMETAESAAPYFAVTSPAAQKPLMQLEKRKTDGRAWQEEAPAAETPNFIDKPEDGQLKTALPAICGDDFKIVGQMFSTYVIVESGNEMLLIDQHAAHERIKYEQLVRDKENGR